MAMFDIRQGRMNPRPWLTALLSFAVWTEAARPADEVVAAMRPGGAMVREFQKLNEQPPDTSSAAAVPASFTEPGSLLEAHMANQRSVASHRHILKHRIAPPGMNGPGPAVPRNIDDDASWINEDGSKVEAEPEGNNQNELAPRNLAQDGESEEVSPEGHEDDDSLAQPEDAGEKDSKTDAFTDLDQQAQPEGQEQSSANGLQPRGQDVPSRQEFESKDLFKKTSAGSVALKAATVGIDQTMHKVDKAIDRVDGAMNTYHKSINSLSDQFGNLHNMASDMHVTVLNEFKDREAARMCAFENVERQLRGEAVQPCGRATMPSNGDYSSHFSESVAQPRDEKLSETAQPANDVASAGSDAVKQASEQGSLDASAEVQHSDDQ